MNNKTRKPLTNFILPSLPMILASDFDDTMTSSGNFPSSALSMLEKLRLRGVATIIVTGRPAGWCDFFARFFPVDAVVGENGALVFSYDRQLKKMNQYYYITDEDRKSAKNNFPKILQSVKAEFPSIELASDQAYRISDLALDFCEDVPAHSAATPYRIKEICESFGATAKVSSIHVNAWYGKFNKQTTLKHYLTTHLKLDFNHLIYVGDSPNDEELFQTTDYSVGVRNIEKFDVHPNFMTNSEGAEGFIELCKKIDLLLPT